MVALFVNSNFICLRVAVLGMYVLTFKTLFVFLSCVFFSTLIFFAEMWPLMHFTQWTTSTSANSNVAQAGEFARFFCSTCPRSYKYKQDLKRHQTLECGKEPQFCCPFCPKKCKRKTHLRNHVVNKHKRVYDFQAIVGWKRRRSFLVILEMCTFFGGEIFHHKTSHTRLLGSSIHFFLSGLPNCLFFNFFKRVLLYFSI